MTDDTNSPTFSHGSFLWQNRRLLLPSGLFVLAIVVVASSHEIAILPVSINGKIGHINPGGKVVIQPQFADAGRFEDGLAPVFVGNTWGYVDKDGKLAIPLQFDVADPLSDGRALVGVQGEFGISRRRELSSSIRNTLGPAAFR